MMIKGDSESQCIDHISTLKQIGDKARDKNVDCIWILWIWRRRMIRLIGKLYGKMLTIYEVGCKLLSIIKSIDVDSLAYVSVKGSYTE